MNIKRYLRLRLPLATEQLILSKYKRIQRKCMYMHRYYHIKRKEKITHAHKFRSKTPLNKR